MTGGRVQRIDTRMLMAAEISTPHDDIIEMHSHFALHSVMNLCGNNVRAWNRFAQFWARCTVPHDFVVIGPVIADQRVDRRGRQRWVNASCTCTQGGDVVDRAARERNVRRVD